MCHLKTCTREGALDPRILDQHCVSWEYAPLKVETCVDLSELEADVSVYLLDMKIGEATLTKENLCVDLGGGAGLFKAKVEICLTLEKPLKIIIDAELCVPLEGCKKYHHEFQLSEGVQLEEQTSLIWGGNPI